MKQLRVCIDCKETDGVMGCYQKVGAKWIAFHCKPEHAKPGDGYCDRKGRCEKDFENASSGLCQYHFHLALQRRRK